MNAELLAGDLALVTGAASGIGRAIAHALAREGAQVVLSDVDTARGQTFAQALNDAGHRAHFIAADLSAEQAPARLFERVLALGSPSILVHAASPRRAEADTVLAVNTDTWTQMLSVNLRAGFLLGRAAGQEMIVRRIGGRILFVTSLHAYTPRNLAHYSASKAGQTMVMKELAKAFGPCGIRVNAIAPGAIPGGGFDAKGAGIERLTRCTSLRRLGTPEDVAGMALALLCDRFSAYVTGTTVVVDGGLALHNWIEPVE